VLGQYDPEDSESAGVPFDFAELVMAGSGKAALVLPYAGATGAVAQTIVIAWKPTREAARAVSAAVPLLQRARRVHVLAFGDAEEQVIGARLDLDGYLKLRGVDAVWHREGGAEPGDVGDLLLSRACDLEADLMVMGCYGHSRAREWVLGGTSRTVLRSMTLPVLMAH
jgi:nucleotide-binding universal stress UspA family protein